jgi:hypothetical protein
LPILSGSPRGTVSNIITEFTPLIAQATDEFRPGAEEAKEIVAATALRRQPSSDSLAWRLDPRKQPPLPGHTRRNCASCRDFAAVARQRLVGDVSQVGLKVAA